MKDGLFLYWLYFALLLVAVTMCGCSGIPLVSNDLAQASGMATAAGDVEGAKCWDCLQRANGPVSGIFGMLEQSRLVRQCRAACVSVLLP